MNEASPSVLKNRNVTVVFKTGAQAQFVAGPNTGLNDFCRDFESFNTNGSQGKFEYQFGLEGAGLGRSTLYVNFNNVEAIFHEEVKPLTESIKEVGEQPSPDVPVGGGPVNDSPR
jgi:hypothetical protein